MFGVRGLFEVDVDDFEAFVAFAFGVCRVCAFVGRCQLNMVGEWRQQSAGPEVAVSDDVDLSTITSDRR